jgi:hypothetical protein
MHSIEHRKPIRHFRFGDGRAELAFMIFMIIIIIAAAAAAAVDVRIVRFTCVGAANAGNFYTTDLSREGVRKL